jgi:hypothetical protein
MAEHSYECFGIFYYMDADAFTLNIAGPEDLVGSNTNKLGGLGDLQEGIDGELTDELSLDMSDEELIRLSTQYESKYSTYGAGIETRQKQNKSYLLGSQKRTGAVQGKTVPSNLLFEATATFVPQALAKNPEPVVFSDNTEDGKKASGDIKTMLQFQAMNLGLRQKLGLMVWHWSVYFTAVKKYGWSEETQDITDEVRKPKNFLLDPDGYVDEFGDFIGWTGERISEVAQDVIDKFPKGKEAITKKVDGKMGTLVVYTEWWSVKGDYCFTTFEDTVLDKHKNEFFNYEKDGIQGENHFSKPKKPYTFLSVFSMQEQPHDMTNLVEQNISNQDRITERDRQIEKNLAHGNNSIVVSDIAFTSETAHQAANALEQGDPILVGGDIDRAIKRIPANPLPNGVLDSQDRDKETLRSIYGTLGLSAQQPNENTTARGMILNQSHDSSRIGGGMGDSLEIVATSTFNWYLQLMYVFYDEKHYGAIMGSASAIEYVGLQMQDHARKYIVSVTPDSMQPKDELSQINQTIQLWEAKALDPIGLFKGINDPDPMASAERLVLWTVNPQAYMQQYFGQGQQPDSANSPQPPEGQPQPDQPPPSLSQEPASASLSNVPLPQ